MAVGLDGVTAVYDGPAVFTDGGVAPIGTFPKQRPRRFVRGSAPNSDDISSAARAAEISPDLLAAVAWRESNFRTDRISPAGAIGEMQLMPGTARELGVDPTKSDQNLRGGAGYLRAMLTRYKGDLTAALAAYNAGPGAVDRYGGLPPFKETQAYVGAILERLSDVAQASAPATAGSIGKGGE